jgi:rhodanese-related sulfurtransferase
VDALAAQSLLKVASIDLFDVRHPELVEAGRHQATPQVRHHPPAVPGFGRATHAASDMRDFSHGEFDVCAGDHTGDIQFINQSKFLDVDPDLRVINRVQHCRNLLVQGRYVSGSAPFCLHRL